MRTLEQILSANLLRLRKAKGFKTQEDFAAAIGKSWRGYQDIERGISWPERETLRAMAHILGVPEAAFFIDPDLIPESLVPASELSLKLLGALFPALDHAQLQDLLAAADALAMSRSGRGELSAKPNKAAK